MAWLALATNDSFLGVVSFVSVSKSHLDGGVRPSALAKHTGQRWPHSFLFLSFLYFSFLLFAVHAHALFFWRTCWCIITTWPNFFLFERTATQWFFFLFNLYLITSFHLTTLAGHQMLRSLSFFLFYLLIANNKNRPSALAIPSLHWTKNNSPH
jgi:hypothetical protein